MTRKNRLLLGLIAAFLAPSAAACTGDAAPARSLLPLVVPAEHAGQDGVLAGFLDTESQTVWFSSPFYHDAIAWAITEKSARDPHVVVRFDDTGVSAWVDDRDGNRWKVADLQLGRNDELQTLPAVAPPIVVDFVIDTKCDMGPDGEIVCGPVNQQP